MHDPPAFHLLPLLPTKLLQYRRSLKDVKIKKQVLRTHRKNIRGVNRVWITQPRWENSPGRCTRKNGEVLRGRFYRACAGMGWFHGHAQGRKSMRPRARCPFRILRGERNQTFAN